MKRVTAHPFRRTAAVSALALIATAFAWVIPGQAGAQEEFVPGSGRAKATIIRVGPSAAQLSLSPSVGVALTDYTNTVGRGEALVVDWAGFHNSVHSCCLELVREFPVLRAVSGEPGAAEGVRWEPKPGIAEAAQATLAPVGRSGSMIEGLHVPGVIEVAGGHARSFSGVYKRTTDGEEELIRAAGGTVDIPRVTLFGGRIAMHGLRWELAQITTGEDDPEPEAIGGFRLGRLVVDGEVQGEGMTEEHLASVLDPINAGFAPMGLAITPPTIKISGQVARIGSLGIRASGDMLAALAEGVQPLRQEVVDRFIAECLKAEEGDGEEEPEEGGGDEGGGDEGGGGGAPGLPLPRVDSRASVQGQSSGGPGGTEPEEFDEFNSTGPGGTQEEVDYEPTPGAPLSSCGTPFLLADIALAPVTGFGRLEIALGGAFGMTEGTRFEGFDLFGGGFDLGGSTSTPTLGASGGTASPPATVAGVTQSNDSGDSFTPPAVEPDAGATQSAPVTDSGSDTVAAPQPVQLTGSRASAAWAVGLVGLGLALFMAGSDFRRLQARRKAVIPIT